MVESVGVILILLVTGFILLVTGGNYLVKSSVSIAGYARISAMITGITIVAFGTSAPELIVSLNAALKHHPDLALGNVIGSNIANIGLILGVTALFIPLMVVAKHLLRNWIFMMISLMVLLVVMADGKISRFDGLLLLSGLAIFIILSIKENNRNVHELKPHQPTLSLWSSCIIFVISVAALYIGSDLVVNNASKLALLMGIDEKIISISLVAFGTSIPELSTSLISAIKKQPEISVGNIIGSNIFNVFCVLGFSSLASPLQITVSKYYLDITVMIGISILLLLLIYPIQQFFSRQHGSSTKIHVVLNRWGGSILLLIYALYILFLFSYE